MITQTGIKIKSFHKNGLQNHRMCAGQIEAATRVPASGGCPVHGGIYADRHLPVNAAGEFGRLPLPSKNKQLYISHLAIPVAFSVINCFLAGRLSPSRVSNISNVRLASSGRTHISQRWRGSLWFSTSSRISFSKSFERWTVNFGLRAL